MHYVIVNGKLIEVVNIMIFVRYIEFLCEYLKPLSMTLIELLFFINMFKHIGRIQVDNN